MGHRMFTVIFQRNFLKRYLEVVFNHKTTIDIIFLFKLKSNNMHDIRV